MSIEEISKDFDSEPIAKQLSDNENISESSDNLTDYSSESGSKSKFLKGTPFETRFPKFSRSKSLKTNYLTPNIVNEEQNEDENYDLLNCLKDLKIKKKEGEIHR